MIIQFVPTPLFDKLVQYLTYDDKEADDAKWQLTVSDFDQIAKPCNLAQLHHHTDA